MRLVPFLVLLLVVGCEQPTKKERPPAAVEEGKVITKTVPYVIRTIGNVRTINQVEVMPQITGQLTGIYIENGAIVEEGELLVTIDPRIYQAELEEAQGQLFESKANLGFNEERVRRYRELLPEDYVSILDFEQYVANEGEAEGQVEQFGGGVNKAVVNLDYCWIRAPMSGKCGIVFPTVGDIMSPDEQQPIVVINQISPIYVGFTVAERFFPLLQKYQISEGLPVTANSLGKTFQGTLSFIDNTMSTTSGTVELRGIFANKKRELWPGQFTDITIELYKIPNAVLAPTRAIRIDTKGHYVFVIQKDSTVKKVSVELGQTQGDYQVITSGLEGGERVVTSGILAVGPGSKVEVTDESV